MRTFSQTNKWMPKSAATRAPGYARNADAAIRGGQIAGSSLLMSELP